MLSAYFGLKCNRIKEGICVCEACRNGAFEEETVRVGNVESGADKCRLSLRG